MEYKIKNQQGYLLILAIVLIIITTFAGALLVSMFISRAGATQNNQQSSAALYIAISGMEFAKYDIVVKHASCTKNRNENHGTGTFTVTGKEFLTTSSLDGTIDDSDKSIRLDNSSDFADNGIISIDNELITYGKNDNNTLLNTTRGAFGTTKSGHPNGARVVQNQCSLTATGKAPSDASPDVKRTIKQPLLGLVGFSDKDASTGRIVFTQMAPATNFFGSFFSIPEDEVKEAAGGSRAITSLAELNSFSLTNPNQIIWVTGKISADGNDAVTIGDKNNPKILIVDDIKLVGQSSLTVYGALYIAGLINATPNITHIKVYGQAAINVNENAEKVDVTSDYAILSRLGILNKLLNRNIVKISYSADSAEIGDSVGVLQEIDF
ncbi:hypothetical protein GAMM_60204 [Gammaproteobacteria bacterium]